MTAIAPLRDRRLNGRQRAQRRGVAGKEEGCSRDDGSTTAVRLQIGDMLSAEESREGRRGRRWRLL
jgi:hypothetical protein